MNNYKFTPLQVLLAVLAFVVFVAVLLFLTEEVGGFQPTPTPRPTGPPTPMYYNYLPIVEKTTITTGTPTPRPTAPGG